MKRILITESQLRLLTENIDDKLINIAKQKFTSTTSPKPREVKQVYEYFKDVLGNEDQKAEELTYKFYGRNYQPCVYLDAYVEYTPDHGFSSFITIFESDLDEIGEHFGMDQMKSPEESRDLINKLVDLNEITEEDVNDLSYIRRLSFEEYLDANGNLYSF